MMYLACTDVVINSCNMLSLFDQIQNTVKLTFCLPSHTATTTALHPGRSFLLVINLMIKTIFMKAVSSIILGEGCYWNSQHIYRDFTIALNQSESWTQPCHVRILLQISILLGGW